MKLCPFKTAKNVLKFYNKVALSTLSEGHWDPLVLSLFCTDLFFIFIIKFLMKMLGYVLSYIVNVLHFNPFKALIRF